MKEDREGRMNRGRKEENGKERRKAGSGGMNGGVNEEKKERREGEGKK